MGFEKTHLFGKCEIDVLATATATLAFLTDLPGNALAQRFVFTIPVTSRTVIRSRLPGAMQGHLVQAICTPSSGVVQLYGVRLWTRELPDGEWGWFELPIVKTPDEYQAVPLPIEATPATYSPVAIPVEATGESYTAMPLPIEATPESYNPVAIPVEATPASFQAMPLPIKPTPPVPRWAEVPVDE